MMRRLRLLIKLAISPKKPTDDVKVAFWETLSAIIRKPEVIEKAIELAPKDASSGK